jgi:hypothetical protein
MADGKTKTNFGLLLEQYRNEYRGSRPVSRRKSKQEEKKGVSQVQLAYLLLEKRGYYLTSGLVNKYELGTRNPTPEFIREVGKVLKLRQEEIDALINAKFADEQLKFWTAYNVKKEEID